MIALGLGVLGLAPRAFWSMTPRELAAAAGLLVPPGTVPPDRATFAALAARFPDRAPPVLLQD